METIRADQIVEIALGAANEELGKLLEADVIAIKSPMRQPLDEIVRVELEEIAKKRDKLAVVLETTGGNVEPVERMATTFRKSYQSVDFLIPNYAYSAGTILAMSGDEIYMDYFSILGPIDPQYPTEEGDLLPGMGYLAKFNELLGKVNADTTGSNSRAELAFLLRKFDPAKLFHIEQAVEHSKALLEEWLPKYKFKNWTKTETRSFDVTDAYKKERAVRIATALGNAERWHSHGRGITMKELMSEDINLKVIDFGDDLKLSAAVRHYHGLFVDYMQKRSMKGAMHSVKRIRRVT